MRKIKTLIRLGSASILSVSALLTIGFAGTAMAANDCTWTGAGDGTSMNSASNWTSCGSTYPQAADTIVLGNISSSSPSLNDNLGYGVAGLTITNSGSGNTNYTINNLSLATGATIDATQANNGNDETTVVATTLTAAGTLTIDGNSYGSAFTATTWNVTGLLTLGNGTEMSIDLDSSDGYTYNLSNSDGILVQNGAELDFFAGNTTQSTPTFPIALGGGSGSAEPIVGFKAYAGGGNGFEDTTWTFANDLTLNNNAYLYLLQAQDTVNQTGSITGSGYALTLDSNSGTGSTLVINPSSNTSATVAGTYTGGGSGVGDQNPVNNDSANGTSTKAAPKTPDTGSALTKAYVALPLIGSIAIATGLFLVSKRNLKLNLKLK